MPFQPGHAKFGGKKKGTLNKRTEHAAEVLARHGFDPIEAILEVYQEASKIYKNYGAIYDAINDAREIAGKFPTEDKSKDYLKLCLDSARELAGYMYPKLKLIEQVKVSALEGMTPEQRLEAMRQAVKALEAQVTNGPSPSGCSDPGSTKASPSSE